VNDGIPKPLYSLSYITVDSAITEIIGQESIACQGRYKKCFSPPTCAPCRSLPSGHELKLTNNNFIDTCLPFGVCSAPKLFNMLADFLSWILSQKGVNPILHYLDDFLIVAPPKLPTCSNNL